MTKQEALKEYFGFEQFRDGQEAIIDHILQHQDTLAIMPTGAGKSLCYQLPGLLLEGITLVISPLISLMKDQVQALNAAGIRAAYLNSSLTFPQYKKALANAKSGMYKFIYVAPERLHTIEFLSFAQAAAIAMVCVDEAHCVSQWGQDFRPSYLKIATFIAKLPQRPIVCAFTATATQEVKEDIQKQLALQQPYEIVTGFDRKNLYFALEKPKDKFERVVAYLLEHPKKSGIIYCLSRKLVEEVCDQLSKEGFAATRYHAGLSSEERSRNQQAFLYDEKNIMVATSAFGMGIDKSNVSFVIHYNMPKDMESYYQEAGRAGRDGNDADCLLLYSPNDVRLNRFLIEQGQPPETLSEEEQQLLKNRERARLRDMTYYCSINTCLRQYMLKYFQEPHPGNCGNCSHCLQDMREIEGIKIAQCIVQSVQECGNRYGLQMMMQVVRGGDNAKIKQWGLKENSGYGKLHMYSKEEVEQIMTQMLVDGYLSQSDGEYPVLCVGQNAYELASRQHYPMQLKQQKEVSNLIHRKDVSYVVDPKLFEELRKVRKSLASKQHVPPYVIFSDKTLLDMCEQRPMNKEELLLVNGVGMVKYRKYGKAFLEVLRKYGSK